MFTSKYFLILFILIFCQISCSNIHDDSSNDFFRLIPSEKSGVNFKNQLEQNPETNILSYLYFYNGAGLSVGDFNNDGLEDIFFASNMSTGDLFLNQGNLKFHKVTKEAQINIPGWSTGTSVVDINSDGLPDIYICQVSQYKSFKGRNLLYVNQGVNEQGIPVFEEKASKYGLDYSGLSTHATFFDYDLDGDLDMYLLNHSVHPIRNYGKGSKRFVTDSIAGDRFFENNKGFFADKTLESGIFSSKIGYGLGVGISDLNDDGYPDIYVGNDFFENDYLYINQKNGSFKEVISANRHMLGHTSHFSMGNDIADMNNDGYTDILSMDMLPEDLVTYKSSGTEYEYNIYQNYLKNGYAPQYMQNTLHLNQRDGYFSEIAFLAGVAASEWSWSGLFMDFDNDGYKDIFISNGIYGATNDMDYINFISNENIQKRLSKGMSEEDLEMIGEIPQKKIPNYFFKNNGDLTFQKLENTMASFSNGSVYADLDNDGDLDIVTNNLNQESFIYENLANENPESNNYLSVQCKGDGQNSMGIGAKLTLYMGNEKQIYEQYLSRGYMSSVSSRINIGLGNVKYIDSICIEWPGGAIEVKENIPSNNLLTFVQSEANKRPMHAQSSDKIFDSVTGLNFRHKERDSYEFNRDPLSPYMLSHQGPKITVGDINGDGLDDLYIGNGKHEKGALFIQDQNGFALSNQLHIDDIKLSENNDNKFIDVDNDGDLDLVIANGGNEYKNEPPLKPSLFINEEGVFLNASSQLPDIYENFSVIAPSDFDDDGDIDLFLGCSSVTGSFGETGNSYLLENDGSGHFRITDENKAPNLNSIGLVHDAKWLDINNDQRPDLMLAGHWMPLSIFLNHDGVLIKSTSTGLENSNGFWNSIEPADLDNDGDIDFVLGNWSQNTRLKASLDKPIRLYRNDFDDNGKVEPVMTYYYEDINTVFSTKDELTKQIPSLNKKFLSYNSFAKAKFIDLFDNDKIEDSELKEVYILKNSYILNDGKGHFELKSLPIAAQVSAVKTIKIDDFNEDGYPDILLAGNNYELNTQLSQLDASHGIILINDTKGKFTQDTKRQRFIKLTGTIKDIKDITIAQKPYYLIARNNDSLLIFDKTKLIYE